jgi:hypothetical protein
MHLVEQSSRSVSHQAARTQGTKSTSGSTPDSPEISSYLAVSLINSHSTRREQQTASADGTQVLLKTFHCEIEWFGKFRSLEVIANDGEMPLLGVGLLLAKVLTIDYTNLTLSLMPAPKKSSG